METNYNAASCSGSGRGVHGRYCDHRSWWKLRLQDIKEANVKAGLFKIPEGYTKMDASGGPSKSAAKKERGLAKPKIETIEVKKGSGKGRSLKHIQMNSIDRHFSGRKINVTEKRATLHIAVNAPKGAALSYTEKTWCSKCTRYWTE